MIWVVCWLLLSCGLSLVMLVRCSLLLVLVWWIRCFIIGIFMLCVEGVLMLGVWVVGSMLR